MEEFSHFISSCLQDTSITSKLTEEVCDLIKLYFDRYGNLLPGETEKHLVHADFDPANILVIQLGGQWQISAILDWEFSFSGSTLWDVANMLRYAHQMPASFQQSFLTGLKDSGTNLPHNWQVTTSLLNIFSLLDCLKRTNPNKTPLQCADIQALIKHILAVLRKIDNDGPL